MREREREGGSLTGLHVVHSVTDVGSFSGNAPSFDLCFCFLNPD